MKVFVNGSFDLLHTGHLDLLYYAKSLGSHLHVAIDIAPLYGAEIQEIPFPEHIKQHYQYYTEADISKLNLLFYE